MPAGAEPPKKETGKVQAKKETVRISLPPKPSAAPTIKLPTLPPGGPATASGAKLGGAPAVAPAAARSPVGAPAQGATAPKAASAPGVAGKRPIAPVKTSALDTILALAAAVVALGAVGVTAYVAFMI